VVLDSASCVSKDIGMAELNAASAPQPTISSEVAAGEVPIAALICSKC
jgi:hypothetical protein